MVDKKKHIIQVIYANIERIEQALDAISEIGEEIDDIDISPAIESWIESITTIINDGNDEGFNINDIIEQINDLDL